MNSHSSPPSVNLVWRPSLVTVSCPDTYEITATCWKDTFWTQLWKINSFCCVCSTAASSPQWIVRADPLFVLYQFSDVDSKVRKYPSQHPEVFIYLLCPAKKDKTNSKTKCGSTEKSTYSLWILLWFVQGWLSSLLTNLMHLLIRNSEPFIYRIFTFKYISCTLEQRAVYTRRLEI